MIKYVLSTLSLVLGLFLANVAFRSYSTPRYGAMLQIIDNPPAFKVSPENFEKNENIPLVRLEEESTKNNPDGFICSGTVISDEYVLTAAHCLVDQNGNLKKSIIIKGLPTGPDNKSLEVISTPAAVNQRADVGLIKGDFKSFQKIKISTSTQLPLILPAEGSVACGFPWGSTATCYPIRFEGIYEFQFAAQGLLYPGMSGGPVINLEVHCVVAINTGIDGSTLILSPMIGMFDYFNIKVE